MIRIVNAYVKFVFLVALCFASVISLLLMPPIGIALMLYLSICLRRQLNGKNMLYPFN